MLWPTPTTGSNSRQTRGRSGAETWDTQNGSAPIHCCRWTIRPTSSRRIHRTAHAGQRFISVGVSEFNKAKNLTREFIFNPGASNEQHLFSPDPGRALITGIGPADDPVLANTNAAV